MSKYTTEVRYICEFYADVDESRGYDEVDNIIAEAKDHIFEQYPIFDESYRSVLNTKILRHYYTREIGAETVGLWKLWLNNTMNEIMPYYNQLYNSALMKFNPFYDVDVKTEHSGSETGVTEGKTKDKTVGENVSVGTGTTTTDMTVESDGSNSTTQRYSDTPQGGLNGMQSVENNLYLTNATLINGTDHRTTDTDGTVTNVNNKTDNNTVNRDGESSSNFNNLNQYAEHVAGKRGGQTYSKMLAEFRKTFLNIDMDIIKDLKDLFFKLY